MYDIETFLAQQHFLDITDRSAYQALQLGACVSWPGNEQFPIDQADLIIIGCGERRGKAQHSSYSDAPNTIRGQLYALYHWHQNIKIYDLGNIREGATQKDTMAALVTVLKEIEALGKIALLLGGSHDLTLGQYEVFKQKEKIIQASVVDMLVNLNETEQTTDQSFLMPMLTGSPNFVGHFNLFGFQSYFVNPKLLETLDKLRFDFVRLGKCREDMDALEPMIRNNELFSFDMKAVNYSDAIANRKGSPNGLTGVEACTFFKYAGMAGKLSSIGLYGYESEDDEDEQTATLCAQMIWYFIDGYATRLKEASLKDLSSFIHYQLHFTGNNISFYKSKITNRWWMQMPDGSFEPCSYQDYLTASQNELPERWLRIHERL